jgi:hypothetical protein
VTKDEAAGLGRNGENAVTRVQKAFEPLPARDRVGRTTRREQRAEDRIGRQAPYALAHPEQWQKAVARRDSLR